MVIAFGTDEPTSLTEAITVEGERSLSRHWGR
jgi:hypothetical protein